MTTLKIEDTIFEIEKNEEPNTKSTISKKNNAEYFIEKDGVRTELVFLKYNEENNSYKIKINGKTTWVQVEDKYDRVLKNMGFNNNTSGKALQLKAPMPGLIIQIQVKEGDSIKKGDTLLTLEAMKMENNIKANQDAIIKKIHVQNGDAVEKNKLLIEFQ